MRWRTIVSVRRGRLVTVPVTVAVLVAAGCAAEINSAPPATESPSDTSASPSSTATTAPTTTAPTTTTVRTTSTSGSSSTSTSTPTVPPAVGQFDCAPAGQAPPIWEVRPPSDIPMPDVPEGWTTAIVGRSVQGRGIEVFVRPVDAARRRVLVIGGLHGNEPVTPPAVRGLLQAAIDPDVEVWLVPVANPDGSAAGLRCNANGVDLNRNFPWEWRPQDGGPAPLSEPETQTLARLVEGLQPDIAIWVHQPLGYVSAIGATSATLEDAWASAAGIPVRPDVAQHGGGESWSAFAAAVPSMLIEIDGWAADPAVVAANRAGFEATVASLD